MYLAITIYMVCSIRSVARGKGTDKKVVKVYRRRKWNIDIVWYFVFTVLAKLFRIFAVWCVWWRMLWICSCIGVHVCERLIRLFYWRLIFYWAGIWWHITIIINPFFSRWELVLYEKEAVKPDKDSTGVAGDEQDCGKRGCRSLLWSSFSHCGKSIAVSEDADCDEIWWSDKLAWFFSSEIIFSFPVIMPSSSQTFAFNTDVSRVANSACFISLCNSCSFRFLITLRELLISCSASSSL